MGRGQTKIGFDIAIVVPGMSFDGATATTQALGGSETAGYYMARELAKLGHHVRVFCNCDQKECSPGRYDDVQYFPLKDWDSFCRMVPHDVSIVQRAPGMFAMPYASRLNWLWCHDMALGRQQSEIMGTMWNIDRVLVLSEFMRQQYQSVYGLPDEALMKTRNGLDLTLFEGFGNLVRDHNRAVYSARPERGVDNLLETLLPTLLKRHPELKLHLCAYTNPAQHFTEFYARVDALIKQYGDRVIWEGALSKRKLYELYATSGLYLYPTPSRVMPMFTEISCISVMEAQAAGLPVITSGRGALTETVQGGILVDGDPWTADYQRAFCDATIEVLENSDRWETLSRKGLEFAQTLSWSAAAEQWSAEMEQQIRTKSSNPDRLVNHFWRHSNIEMARKVIAEQREEVDPSIVAKIEQDFAFTSDDRAFRQHYEKIGTTHGPLIDHHVGELRYQVLERWLSERPELDRVIDYGCAYGSYLLNLVRRLPAGRQWVGLDVDNNGIELARKHASTLLTPEQRNSVKLFNTESVDLNSLFGEKKANALVLFEVLEHVVDPLALISHVESLVEPGGKVIITVPYGPWEYGSYYDYPYRCHLWEYDWHDLRDMFGGKEQVTISPLGGGIAAETKEPLGWWLVEYTVNPERKTGAIDLERKRWLQAPRETVSTTLIAGPGAEDTLHWCLRSVRHVTDELVVVDCGMSDEARRIVEQHFEWYRGAAKLIANGSDPKKHGFETPRNEGLAHCTKDWVFWLDTDEKLLGTDAMHKYLRANIYNGYCMKQMHFACDTTFDPDTPVRLFRRLQEGESKIRWYGMIHEHPELGINLGPGRVVALGDIWIPHVGYLNEDIRRKRFVRNAPLLQRDIEKYPDRLLQKHFIIRDKVLACMHEIQRNGGQITDAIKREAEEVVELYRKHFRDQKTMAGINSIQFYSQACQILGIGAEVAFQLAATKTGRPETNGTKYYRFANIEDLEAELMKEVREHAAPLMGDLY